MYRSSCDDAARHRVKHFMTPKNFNTNEKFLMTTNMLHIISTQAIKIKCVHDFRRNCQGHITSILIDILLRFRLSIEMMYTNGK